MSSFLSSTEREALLRELHLEKERRFAYRINTILLLDDGLSYSEISRVLFLDDSTIGRYLKKYKQGGLEGLLELHHIGRSCKLSLADLASLKQHLSVSFYRCTKEIVDHVLTEYKISYSTRGMHHLLIRLGFVYKKTKAIPGKADPEAQERFVALYDYLMENKAEDDPVYFIDGVHPQHNAHPAFGWILKGKDKQILTNTGRKRVNINGALNIETLDVVTRVDDTINADSTVALFAGIEQKHLDAKNIYVICDNAGYNFGKKVRYYEANSKIKVIYLPSYSPNLNPIERLWKFFKKKVANNRYYENYKEFRKACIDFFKNLELYERDLDSLLTDNFEIVRPTNLVV